MRVTALLSAPPAEAYKEAMNRNAILEEPVGAVAARHRGLRSLFEDLGLDYYTAGHLTVEEACRGAGVDVKTALPLLRDAAAVGAGVNWEDASLGDLVKHLESEHHSVVRIALYRTSLLFADACRAANDIRLAAMRIAFRRLSTTIVAHMEHEELTVFPAVLALEEAWIKNESPPPRFEGGVRAVVSRLMIEHFEIARKLAELHAAHEAIAETERASCARLFSELEQLERHLHEYISLENYVAFPRALALEEALVGRAPKEEAV